MNDENEGNYIIEFITIGNSMKATAIDPVTLVEASVIAPSTLPRSDVSTLAIKKLSYLLEKQRKNENP